MAIWNSLSGILNTGRVGAGWQPKASKIRVGRDVGALTSTTFCGQTMPNTVIGNGDDVSLKSKDIFNLARNAAQKGYGVRQFRSISDKDIKDGTVFYPPSIKNGDYSVTVMDGTLFVHKKHEEEGELPVLVMKAAITEDARLVWNENGEPELLTGNAARTKGVLQAQSENEVILSLSGSDVEAGESTVVWNLSGKAGTYSGGNNVTYLGTYEGGTFTNTEGKVTFGGYFNKAFFSNISGISEFSGVFDEASVALEKGYGTFSGYFSASEITGATTNKMNGLFLNACSVKGGEGDDNFNGRFIDSDVDAGEGDNSFGYGSLNLMRELVGPNIVNGKMYFRNYSGVEADFINAAVTAGSGKDHVNGVAWGSSFDLGLGDDSTDGIFSETVINGGGGNDTLQAEYAVRSSFAVGDGDDSVTLETATFNAITTGEGTNAITMGLNDAAPSAPTWQTRDEYFNHERPRETGELSGNTVDATLGESAIIVNNGETSRRVVVRARYAEDDAETGETKVAGEMDKADAAATLEEKLPPAMHKVIGIAIGRYHKALGMEPQNKDETALTIEYGDGSRESLMSAKRENARANREEAGMIRAIRRYTFDGASSWNRWQRLGD